MQSIKNYLNQHAMQIAFAAIAVVMIMIDPASGSILSAGGAFLIGATENIKSTVVTNADATPVDLSASYLQHGRLREAIGICEAAGGDAGSTYRLVRVWSGWRISDVVFACDDLGTGGTLDVGIYQTAENGGAVVDADLFASALDCATAITRGSIINESGVVNIDDSEKRLWEMLGLSADPQRWYDVVATSNTAAATGTIMGAVRYVDGT